MSYFEKSLLDYAAIPRDKVIAEVLSTVGKAQVAGSKEYDLLEVLSSYETPRIDPVLKMLAENGSNLSKYGKVLLLDYLGGEARRMSDDQKQDTLKTLKELNYEEPKLQRQVFSITGLIEGDIKIEQE